jgi:hypothetical protein
MMCVVLFNGAGLAAEVAANVSGDVVGRADIDPQDIEIINDLDLFQNWDDLQDEKGFEKNMSEDQETEGGSREQ